LLAGAAHAALLVAMPREAAVVPAAARGPAEAEIELAEGLEPPPAAEEPTAALEQPAAPPPAKAAVATAAREPASPAASAGVAALETAPSGTAEPAPSAEPGAAPSGTAPWSFDGRQPPDVTSSAFIARATQGIGAEGLAPRGPSTTGGLVEGLDARDSAVGIGRGGLVVSALETAAASADAPFEGAATFDVGIDTSGHVSIAVLDTSVASPGWSRLAAAARAAIDPSRMRIPPGARGWHVVARLEAKVQYPNGADPKKMGTAVEASPGKLVVDPNRPHAHAPPIVFEKLPGVTLAHSGKVCTVRITLGLTPVPISGGCDPANIGMNPLRVVHGRVVSEGRL
jgi:hypothetical protein